MKKLFTILFTLSLFVLYNCSQPTTEEEPKTLFTGDQFLVEEYKLVNSIKQNDHHYYISVENNNFLGRIDKYFPTDTTPVHSYPENMEKYFNFHIMYKMNTDLELTKIINPGDFLYPIRSSLKKQIEEVITYSPDSIRPLLEYIKTYSTDSANVINHNTRDLALYNLSQKLIEKEIDLNSIDLCKKDSSIIYTWTNSISEDILPQFYEIASSLDDLNNLPKNLIDSISIEIDNQSNKAMRLTQYRSLKNGGVHYSKVLEMRAID